MGVQLVLLRLDLAVQKGGTGGPEELCKSVRDAPAEAQLRGGDVDAKGHRRVEGGATDRAGTVAPSDDHKPDREAVILVPLGRLGCGHVQHHEAEHESIEKLDEARLPPAEAVPRSQVKSLPREEPPVAERSHHASEALY